MGGKAADAENIQAGRIRPNQFLVTYGPGAIFNGTHDSFTIMDIDLWDEKIVQDMPLIEEPSLINRLGVTELRGFPVGSEDEDDDTDEGSSKSKGRDDNSEWGLPVSVFPSYHVCRNCSRLFRVNDHYENYDKTKGPLCPDCGEESYPAGYIVACENGHMDDFPWSFMFHEGSACKNEKCENEKLFLEIDDEAKKWRPKRILCKGCDKEAAAELNSDIWKRTYACYGRCPQRGKEGKASKCEEHAKLMRRDSSSVYYPVTQSTISIPARRDIIDELIQGQFTKDALENVQFAEINGTLDACYRERFSQICSREEFDKAYDRINSAARDLGSMNRVYENIKKYGVVYDFADVKDMEHYAITHYANPDSDKLSVKEVTADINGESRAYFSGLYRIKTLNEVNVLLGFTRREPPDPSLQIRYKVDPAEKTPNDHICRLANGSSDWLPAVKLKGEGIYLEINPEKTEAWMQTESVKELSDIYRDHYEKSCEQRGWQVTQIRDAKYVLLHTLAHLLLKELSLYCGYEQPGLKERIYCSDKMSGILIYTDSPDRNGSLGGLEELAEWGRFAPVLKAALTNALVCPQDPQCALKSPAADEFLDERHYMNGAACYSCAMIPDISCENRNQMLDRALVVPLAGRQDLGFFTRDYIDSLPDC